MRKGSPIVRPASVTVRIGKPVPTAGMTLDERHELIAVVRGRIEQMLREG